MLKKLLNNFGIRTIDGHLVRTMQSFILDVPEDYDNEKQLSKFWEQEVDKIRVMEWDDFQKYNNQNLAGINLLKPGKRYKVQVLKVGMRSLDSNEKFHSDNLVAFLMDNKSLFVGLRGLTFIQQYLDETLYERDHTIMSFGVDARSWDREDKEKLLIGGFGFSFSVGVDKDKYLLLRDYSSYYSPGLAYILQVNEV